MNKYICWVTGDRTRCWAFIALDIKEAEKMAAEYFGVTVKQISSREVAE